jgi:hypothetical protein
MRRLPALPARNRGIPRRRLRRFGCLSKRALSKLNRQEGSDAAAHRCSHALCACRADAAGVRRRSNTKEQKWLRCHAACCKHNRQKWQRLTESKGRAAGDHTVVEASPDECTRSLINICNCLTSRDRRCRNAFTIQTPPLTAQLHWLSRWHSAGAAF